MPWLQALTAVDLQLTFENGKDFAATQEMTEEFRQEVSYQGAFGRVGPVLRRKRPADEGSITFTAILLKQGASRGMAHEETLKGMNDFDITCKRGPHVKTYSGCNWNRITVRSTLDQVTLDCDISVPGYDEPFQVGEVEKASSGGGGSNLTLPGISSVFG